MKAIFYFALVFFLMQMPDTDSSIVLTLNTTAKPKGVVRLAVYTNAAEFEQESPSIGQVVELEGKQFPIEVELSNLPSGKVVVAAYHDINNDDKLNRNFFGVPTEPYGFSRKPVSKMRAPEWEEVAILIKDQKSEVTLDLKPWKQW